MNRFMALIVVTILMSGCSFKVNNPSVSFDPTSHQLIAIVPSNVSIAKQKKADSKIIEDQEKAEAINFQIEIYNWFLRRKMNNEFYAEIQDIETTNAILRKAGFYDTEQLTYTEISETLGVDALIISNFEFPKPLPVVADVALRLLSGYWYNSSGATVHSNVRIYDTKQRSLVWMYKHTTTLSIRSTPSDLVNVLMRHVSKQMPYK